jgi:hypothetical protein
MILGNRTPIDEIDKNLNVEKYKNCKLKIGNHLIPNSLLVIDVYKNDPRDGSIRMIFHGNDSTNYSCNENHFENDLVLDEMDFDWILDGRKLPHVGNVYYHSGTKHYYQIFKHSIDVEKKEIFIHYRWYDFENKKPLETLNHLSGFSRELNDWWNNASDDPNDSTKKFVKIILQ